MQKYLIWITALFSIFFVFYHSLSIIDPFFVSFVIAYFLYPKIDSLERKFGMNRALASILVVLTFCFVISFILSILIPELFEQASIVVRELPRYENYLQSEFIPSVAAKLSKIDSRFAAAFASAINSSISMVMSNIVLVFHNMISYTVATLTSIFAIFLFPIILFYLLLDWHHMFKYIYSMVPDGYHKKYRDICSDIGSLMSGYIRGQFYICLGVSLYYSIWFTILGLPAAILLGLMCGFAIIVPLLGAITSLLITLAIAYFSSGSPLILIYILMLFSISQIIEGNIVTPKIIGDKIGIHPLAIIFSVLFFANLLGLFGVLFAIPISGILKVLLKHACASYASLREV
jgi:putative permease